MANLNQTVSFKENEGNDPACFLPEGSEALFHYIQEDLLNDCDSNSEDEESSAEGYTVKVFLKAAEKGKIDVVSKILDSNESFINCKDCDGYTALHRASYNGHIEMVKLLISLNADVNSVTNNMWQPLHSACRWDQTAVAYILLQNGADINAQTCGGQTPLHLAVTYARGNSLLEVLLLNKKLDVNIVNCQNKTALDLAKPLGKESLFEVVEDSINVQW